MMTRRSHPVALVTAVSAISVVGVAPLVGATASHAQGSAAASSAAVDPLSIETDKIKDLTATLRINDDETNFDELKKIGGAFATTYRVSKTMDVAYKYPNKARFEGHALGATISLVYNGDMKSFHTPIKSQTQNVANQPGQKQNLMDLGIFAKDYLQTDYLPEFVKRDGALVVFKLVQRNTNNKSHELVWVNPKNSIIERRQTFNGGDKLQKEIRFVRPQQIRPGIWVPSRIEIYNQYGKLGAVQDISDIKVNLGVDDDLFKIS